MEMLSGYYVVKVKHYLEKGNGLNPFSLIWDDQIVEVEGIEDKKEPFLPIKGTSD